MQSFALRIRMLSGVLRGESSAVDTRPALSTSDSIWLDGPRPDAACPGLVASRYGVYVASPPRHPAGIRPGRPGT
jgi:hypothetical protein